MYCDDENLKENASGKTATAYLNGKTNQGPSSSIEPASLDLGPPFDHNQVT